MKKAFLLALLLPVLVWAQPTSLRGIVTESGSNSPLLGVSVRAVNLTDTSKVIVTYTSARGEYGFRGLTEGEYRIRFKIIGHKEFVVQSLRIAPGDEKRLDASLIPQPVNIDAIVISASRREEKVLDAPASATILSAKEISERPTLTPIDHVRTTPGVDVAETGLAQQSVVVRGFNNVATTALTILTDNRIAAVPSLRINVPSFIPLVSDDIDHIEVVRGPASALYGPNASQGVLNIVTRSPFASKGTSISLVGGNRSLFQGYLRHAGALGQNIGFKISGQYLRGNDWEYVDSTEASNRAAAIADGAREDTLKLGQRDPLHQRFSGEGRVDFLIVDRLTATAAVGFNQAVRSIELTDVGAAQVKDWRYTYYQARITYGDFFLQSFLNQSDAGKTYLLRNGDAIVDRSKQFVAQAQHALSFGEKQRLIYGADLLLTRPITDGTITGRNEEDDDIDEYGGYLQSETHLLKNALEIVFAGRLDKHNRLADPIFSPRAAFVLKPWENQNFRLTFNRAYSTPSTADLFLDLSANPNVFGLPQEYAIALRASGVPSSGFSFNRDSRGRPFMYSPFSPDRSVPMPIDVATQFWPVAAAIVAEQLRMQGIDPSVVAALLSIPAPDPTQVRSVMGVLNTETRSFDAVDGPNDITPLKPTITQTIELGYKGIIADKLQAGIDLYRSKITDFTGALQIITPNVFLNGVDAKAYLKPFIKQGLLDQGYPESQAEGIAEAQSTQLGAAIGQIPLGTVSPREATDPTALIVASRNYGEVAVMGIDLSLEYQVNDQISFAGTYSHVNKNFFEKLGGVADQSLNSPRNKGSLSVKYRNSGIGLNAELRNRWTGGFRMNSGVYLGTVNSYSLLDATIGYDIPGIKGLTATISATNLLDNKHQEFIGAPLIGRLVLGRLAYTF